MTKVVLLYLSPPCVCRYLSDFEDYEFPEPPTEFDNDYKNNGGGGNTEKKKDEINFEDLAERFKKLTKK